MLRLALSPRWILWHVLTLGAMATCTWLAIWQWQRAGSALGSALNVGYGLQWPVFAVCFAVMWWRMLRLEARDVAVRDPVAETPVEPAAVADGPSPFTPRPHTLVPAAADTDPVRAEYNRRLARLAARDEQS